MQKSLLNRIFKGVSLCFVACVLHSCGMSMETTGANGTPIYYKPWMYDFGDEVTNPTTTIKIVTDGTVDLNSLNVEIPPLKYNKELLFLLSQDDSRHSTLCYTWAMLNGRPFGSDTRYEEEHAYFYHIEELLFFDMHDHPYVMPSKTLGCTDGAGNEVRFNFTMTVMPFLGGFGVDHNYDISSSTLLDNLYDSETKTRLVYKGNDSSISWNDVRYMANYGVGVSLHDADIPVTLVHDLPVIARGLADIQEQIADSLNGRGTKMLCEPNGNRSYLDAVLQNPNLGIKVLTAQENADLFLVPAQVHGDLDKSTIFRDFRSFGANKSWVDMCDNAMAIDFDNRPAVSIGVHGTCASYVYTWFKGINDKYGKDGSDVIWMPSQEEYYEYNYYRQHAQIEKKIDGNTLELTVTLPTENSFYYPATTLNLVGVDMQHIVSIEADDVTTGMSYANYHASYGDGVMINIDCRKFLIDLARHYVEDYYTKYQSGYIYNKWDAIYFTKMLKPGATRDYLLELCQ